MKKQYKVLYGWRYERIGEKARWFQGLSFSERYITMMNCLRFANVLRKKKIYPYHDRRTFTTIQILKLK